MAILKDLIRERDELSRRIERITDITKEVENLTKDILASKIHFVDLYEEVNTIRTKKRYHPDNDARSISTSELTDAIRRTYAEHSEVFLQFIINRITYHTAEGDLDAEFFRAIKRT